MGLKVEEQLFPVAEETYGPEYKNHFIEIYKLYVEMADRVSSRRQTANSFYLTVNTAIVGAATFFQIPALEGFWLVPVAGVTLCAMWIRNIQSYKDLNSGKFRVINEIERRLPIAPYDAEWEILQRDKKNSAYRPFHSVEKYVPQIFILLYIAVVMLSVDWPSLCRALCTMLGICEAP
jgi:hypothetical protein